jgi:hypothetical protein
MKRLSSHSTMFTGIVADELMSFLSIYYVHSYYHLWWCISSSVKKDMVGAKGLDDRVGRWSLLYAIIQSIYI